MTPELKQRIEKEAVEYATKHSSAPDKETPDWIIADYKAGATAWAERAEKLREALEGIRDGYDHERDAHKYNNGACRCCIATKALENYKKETA